MKLDSNFFNSFRKKHSGVILIEAAVTLPVVMYIMLFCLELVKIYLLQISIDKICAECVYHLCSERTVGSFDSVFEKYKPSYVKDANLKYYCRVYSSLENMMNAEPYGGEGIAYPYEGDNHSKWTDMARSIQFGISDHPAKLKKYDGIFYPADIGTARISQLTTGVNKGYAFVLTVVAKHQFSSAFVEKLFNGGSNTTVPGYYILWSRGVGIVN